MPSRKTWPEATKKKRESFRRFIFARRPRALARWRYPKFKPRREIRMNWIEFKETPHRRWNPLLREWVLVSPHRAQRPWLGQVARPAASSQIEYDPECYLCPGNARSQ